MTPIARALPPLLLAAAPVLAAQTPRDTVLLPPIVITATRAPAPVTALGSAVTVIEGDALRRAGIASVAEALRETPSTAVAQAGSWGAQTSLFLRGGENDYVRVLVDGVPLNQAGGSLDLAGLTTDNVERIEIVRGPASVLYGSDAMTGVVQIITRRGRGPGRMAVSARAGSFATTEVAASVAAGGDRLSASGGFERQATDGIAAFNNGLVNAAGSARVAWTPDAASEISAVIRSRAGRYHYPTDGAGNVVDSNQFQDSRLTALAVEASRRLWPAVEARLHLGVDARRDSVDDAPDSPGDTLGFYAYRSRTDYERYAADLRASVALSPRTTASLGGTFEEQREQAATAYESQFGGGTGTSDVVRANRALYAQLVADRGPVGLQAGLRLDDNQRFGRFITWRTAASVRVGRTTRLRVNAGTAFKEPTFVENFAQGYAVGNTDLRPERTTSGEAGIEQGLLGGRLTLAATGFAQRFQDMVQYTFVTAAPTDPNFYNVASADAAGLELEAHAIPAAAVRVALAYTWLRTSAVDSGFDGTVFQEGQRLLRRPTHSGNLSLEFTGVRARLGLRLLAVGSRDDLDFGGFPTQRVVLPAYGRLDLWGDAPLTGAVALTIRADNVTGTRYAEIQGFPAPGRRVLVGIRVDAGR